MKRNEFAELVETVRIRPVTPPGGQRHVYLWHGDLATLNALLVRASVVSLDLHELTRSLERKPTDLNAARRVLEGAVAEWLHSHGTHEDEHQIIVVSGCDLLMRYQVSLGSFMQFATDSRLVVLVVPPYREPSSPLPTYVDFRATGILDYLRRFVPDSSIVE